MPRPRRRRRPTTPSRPRKPRAYRHSIANQAEPARQQQPAQANPATIAVNPDAALAWQLHLFVELFVAAFGDIDAVLNRYRDAGYCKNRVNVYVALFLYDHKLGTGLYPMLNSRLLRLARSIALQKGLRDRGALNGEVYQTAVDDLLTNALRAGYHPNAASLARLLFLGQMPDGSPANYGRILEQRLFDVLELDREKMASALRDATVFDSLDVPVLRETEILPDGTEQVTFRPLAISREEESRIYTTIQKLRAGCTFIELALWEAAASIKTDPSLHWAAFANDFKDPLSGKVPAPTALRKAWSRLRDKLMARFRIETGLISPSRQRLAPAEEIRVGTWLRRLAAQPVQIDRQLFE